MGGRDDEMQPKGECHLITGMSPSFDNLLSFRIFSHINKFTVAEDSRGNDTANAILRYYL